MNEVINGHRALPVLDAIRHAKQHVGNNLYIAIQYLQAAHATNVAHALPYPLPEVGPLQAALDLINKDLSNTENQP